MKKLFIYFLMILPAVVFGNDSENIVYHLKLGFIKGGEATINISDTIYQGNEAINYKLLAETTGIVDKLYNVHDIYETTADAKTLLPLKSIRNIKERKYRYYNEVNYYHNIDSIYSQRSGWRMAPENLVDIITVFFYFTNQNLIENIGHGDIITLPTFHADEINDINIKFLGYETLKTKIGKLECYVLSPQVKKGKLLKRSDGVKFYITKDTKIPVLLEFDMKVGKLKAILKDYDSDE